MTVQLEPEARPELDAPRKRVLVAYSASSTFVQTTFDYLESLARHLDADVDFMHVTQDAIPGIDLETYDAVFHSYCARLPFKGYVSRAYTDAMAAYSGVKIAAVQDEYENTNGLKQALNEIGFDVVLTCVPTDQIEKVYPKSEFPHTRFVQVLTGYVPDDLERLAAFALPLKERGLVIGYRGRDIGGLFGRLAFDKLEIGRRMKAACEARGLPVDIDWTDESRIYGTDWFRFLGSCRATLGTESGSNVFDFDGSIRARFDAMTQETGQLPPYEDFLPTVRALEETMDMGQISPKMFEAIALRTPLILLRGRYSGVLMPDVHYIPLERDYSNITSVLDRLSDLPALEAMAERAYADVVASSRYSYQSFAQLIDSLIASAGPRCPPLAQTAAANTMDEALRQILTQVPTKAPLTLADFQRHMAARAAYYQSRQPPPLSLPMRIRLHLTRLVRQIPGVGPLAERIYKRWRQPA